MEELSFAAVVADYMVALSAGISRDLVVIAQVSILGAGLASLLFCSYLRPAS
jgi:xanthine/uracil permease